MPAAVVEWQNIKDFNGITAGQWCRIPSTVPAGTQTVPSVRA